jgi:hypothetical protein
VPVINREIVSPFVSVSVTELLCSSVEDSVRVIVLVKLTEDDASGVRVTLVSSLCVADVVRVCGLVCVTLTSCDRLSSRVLVMIVVRLLLLVKVVVGPSDADTDRLFEGERAPLSVID